MERFQVGQVMPLRENGEWIADVRIRRRFQSSDEELMVETEIVEMSATYRGTLKLGAKITFPEDGFVGTFENPCDE